MQIRVINLDRTLDRLTAFCAHNLHMPGIERVAAVDGRTLDRARLESAGLIMPDAPYTPGAIGNALSHMSQWEDAAARDTPLTVLEDDAVLCGNFVEESGRIIAALGPGWDFVQWGYNFNTVLSYELLPGVTSCAAVFDQDRMRRVLPVFHQRSVETSAYRVLRSLGMPAYSVSPRGAARLLAFCRPIRRLDIDFPLLGLRSNYSIDFMMNGAYAAMEAYVAVPALALTANDSSRSTVQDLSDQASPAHKADITGAIG